MPILLERAMQPRYNAWLSSCTDLVRIAGLARFYALFPEIRTFIVFGSSLCQGR